MHTLQTRERALEDYDAHKSETAFRVSARRSRLFGQWAARQLGLVNGEADSYAESTVMEAFAGHGDNERVISKVYGDFANQGLALSIQELSQEYESLHSTAARELGTSYTTTS